MSDSIDKLVYFSLKANLENREKAKKQNYNKQISKAQWFEQFCTIHINIGRNSGKTTHIVEMAQPEDLIVCRNGTKMFIEENSKHGNNLHFLVPHISRIPVGRKYYSIFADCQIVFVDEPKMTLLPYKDLSEFYHSFMVNFNEPIFIMLGE